MFKIVSASICVAAAAWCSLGSVGLLNSGSSVTRIALLAPWWLLSILFVAAMVAIKVSGLSSSELWPIFTSALAIVPWLPLPLPAAALLWTGPFVATVWTAVIVGVVAVRRRPIRTRWLIDPTPARFAAGALALFIYVATAWWLAPIPPSGDSPHYLILTQSLLRDGDIRIENNHTQGDYLDYYPGALKPDYLRRGVNGEIYSIHAPGLPALIAPAFFAFGLTGVYIFLAIVGAIGTAIVWHLGYRITGDAGAAWFGWACAALTSPFLFSATAIFPDALAATLLLIGVLPLLDPDGDRWSWRTWLLSGVALALMPWLGSRLSLLSGAAGVCLLFRTRRVSQFVGVALPGALGALLWFGFFFVVYRSLSPSAPYGSYTQMAAVNLTRSIPGFLFDEQFGLIPNAPVYAFILAGIVSAMVRLRRWSLELLAISIPYMIAVGMWMIWWAATSSPARYWTPLALLFGIAAARLWHEMNSPAVRALASAALVASLLISLVLLVPDRGRLLFNFRDGVALWLEWANDHLDLPRGLPSLFHDTLPQVWLKAAIWTAALAVACVVVRMVDNQQSSDRRRAILSLTTPLSLAGAIMIALSLSWRVDGSQPLTPQTSTIDLLRHAPRPGAKPSFRSVAFDFGARRFESTYTSLENGRLTTSDRRPQPRPEPLLLLSRVPAGVYRLHLSHSGEPSGALRVRVGSSSLPLYSWSVSAAASNVPLEISFPVAIRSLTIDGDDQARRMVTSLALQPVFRDSSTTSSDLRGLSAGTAAAYGSAETYFVDEYAYPEAQGFWIVGGREALIAVDNRKRPLRLFLRNAPVENHVTLEIDGELQEFDLGPGEEKTIDRTATTDVISLRVATTSGFRPWSLDHANADMRYLGCWVEIR